MNYGAAQQGSFRKSPGRQSKTAKGNPMAKHSRKLTDLNQDTLDAALEFARVSIDSAERVMRKQLEAANKIVAQQS